MNVKRPLTQGCYTPSDAFKRIQEHAAVMYADDRGLVAVTGPASDEESIQHARLFAAAPVLLAACKRAEQDLLCGVYQRLLDKQANLAGEVGTVYDVGILLLDAISLVEGKGYLQGEGDGASAARPLREAAQAAFDHVTSICRREVPRGEDLDTWAEQADTEHARLYRQLRDALQREPVS